MLSLEQYIRACPQHLWIELSPQQQEMAQTETLNHSNDVARWNAYMNTLCVNGLIQWLREEPELQQEKLSLFPSQKALPSLWECVNGSAIQLGATRLVLIPSDRVETETFSIPWEWVDIPNLAGDYYLAVQMNLEEEECWMRVWGFATHAIVKEAKRDRVKRTYLVEREERVESPNSLWVSRELYPPEKPVVEPLRALSEVEARSLLERLSLQRAYSPRLEVPFERWAALFANEKWREKLYCQRVVPGDSAIVKLGQWLHKAFEEGWEAMESLPPTLAFRNGSPEIEHSEVGEITRCKRLALEHSGSQIALRMGITPTESPESKISVELIPLNDRAELPSEVQLIVLDEEGNIAMQAEAGNSDGLEFQFRGEPGERFGIKVMVGEFSVTEEFLI